MSPVARLLGACALALAAPACSGMTTRPVVDPAGREIPVKRLAGDTRLAGRVELDRLLYVPAGVTLTLAPGTELVMMPVDRDGDRVGDAGIFCRGTIIAEGTAEHPIRVGPPRGADAPPPIGDGTTDQWGEVKLERSRGSRFRHVIFEQAHWALHVHFAEVDVERSVLRRGEGGIRFRAGRVRLVGNELAENRVGVRFWYAAPTIVDNDFVDNDTGIFIREGVAGFPFERNAFRSRRYHVQLGERQLGSVGAAGNWWGTRDPDVIRSFLFDRSKEPEIGEVRFEPVLAGPPARDRDAPGPRGAYLAPPAGDGA